MIQWCVDVIEVMGIQLLYFEEGENYQSAMVGIHINGEEGENPYPMLVINEDALVIEEGDKKNIDGPQVM